MLEPRPEIRTATRFLLTAIPFAKGAAQAERSSPASASYDPSGGSYGESVCRATVWGFTRSQRAIGLDSAKAAFCSLPPCGEGWGGGYQFDLENLIPPLPPRAQARGAASPTRSPQGGR